MLAMWSQNIFLPSDDYCCSTIGGAGASEQFFLLSMLFRSVRALCCLLHFHVSFGSISPSMEYLPPDQVTVGAYYYPWWKHHFEVTKGGLPEAFQRRTEACRGLPKRLINLFLQMCVYVHKGICTAIYRGMTQPLSLSPCKT